MATTKHLDPTNVDISIPAMTDQPNASVFSNCVDKEADAINALNSKLVKESVGSSSYGSVSAKKAVAGNVVVITGSFGASSDAAADTVFLTGLPAVDGPNFTPITAFDNTGASAVSWVLRSDGTIQNRDTIIRDHSYRFSFSYVTT